MKAAMRRVVPFALAMVLGYWIFVAGRVEELEEQDSVLQRLVEEYANKKRQAVNVDLLREQLREVDTMLGEVMKALPNRFDRGFGDVLDAAGRHRVRVEHLDPGT